MKRALSLLLCLSLGGSTWAARDFEANDSADYLEASAATYNTMPWYSHTLSRREDHANSVLFSVNESPGGASEEYFAEYHPSTVRRALHRGGGTSAFADHGTEIPNEWSHGTAGFVSNTSRKIWQDGADPVENTTANTEEGTSDTTQIGAFQAPADFFWDGQVDWVSVHKGTATTAKALDLASGRDPRTTADTCEMLVRLLGSSPEQDVCGGLTFAVNGTPVVTGSRPAGW